MDLFMNRCWETAILWAFHSDKLGILVFSLYFCLSEKCFRYLPPSLASAIHLPQVANQEFSNTGFTSSSSTFLIQ